MSKLINISFTTRASQGFGGSGRMAIYFLGSGKQAHSFGDLGSSVKKQKYKF